MDRNTFWIEKNFAASFRVLPKVDAACISHIIENIFIFICLSKTIRKRQGSCLKN